MQTDQSNLTSCKRWHKRFKKSTVVSVVFTTFSLAGCDGSVQLCGEYACAYYQTSCEAQNTCTESKQCESAGSIRDRAPNIINELRETQRACGSDGQELNRTRLVWDENLASASDSHSKDMAANQFESFNGTNGLSSTERVEMTGFNASLVLESIGGGPQTTAEVINTWLDVDTDCTQMLNSNTNRIGMACSLSDEPEATPYWSLILATSESDALQQ